MADVRKEGPHFRTTHRIYRPGYGDARVLLYPEGKLLRIADVERHGLSIEGDKPASKSRKPQENK